MSPTAIFDPRVHAGHPGRSVPGVGGGVPGVVGRVGTGVGGWEGYTGTRPPTIPGPIFNIFKAIGPTHGQMKAILDYL